MDMHGEMGPIATKMAKAMTDAPTMEQRMVGGGAADALFRGSSLLSYEERSFCQDRLGTNTGKR